MRLWWPRHSTAACKRYVVSCSKAAPAAQHAAKDLLEGLRQGHPFDDTLLEDTAQRIAAIRATAEAREGLSAFFEKRPCRLVSVRNCQLCSQKF